MTFTKGQGQQRLLLRAGLMGPRVLGGAHKETKGGLGMPRAPASLETTGSNDVVSLFNWC